LVGIDNAGDAEKVVSNHFYENNVITLARKAQPGVEYKREVLVNKKLFEVIN